MATHPPGGAQGMPLLRTKLYIPAPRPALVSRPRLIERLNAGLHRKLTLLSAPAGFGKTTLVSEWIASYRPGGPRSEGVGAQGVAPQVAWLSLDESDNDPTRFLTYLVAALQTVQANIGEGVLSALQSPQPPPAEVILTALINDIAAHSASARIVLVLDDYHLIDVACPASAPIHNALTFLLRHLPQAAGPPAGLHLVISTREDPHLPLARLRARGQLTELRATDLRFTPAQAAEFLNQVMGLGLSADDIAALETRTEGWVAGLQLAALSMQGHKDVTGFIQSFTGSHHFVLDYLVEEVLEQQPEDTQAFLLQTAVLDRLTGSLCDAVRFGESKSPSSSDGPAAQSGDARAGGQATLEMLEHANLFIVSLDEERCWYRYHHLFADLLRQRLRHTQPEQMPTLHRRAAKWYKDKGLTVEALQHVFAAGDSEWAACLVEQIGTASLWERHDLTSLAYWLEKLPQAVVHSHPKLCLLSAWAMYGSGQPDAIAPYLRSVESHLQESGHSGDAQSMMAELTAIRAYTARVQGDLPRTIELFQRALELLHSDELHLRAVVLGGLADAHYLRGDILAAGSLFPEASAIGWKGANTYMASFSARRLAEVLVMQGHLQQAADAYQQILRMLATRGEQEATVAGNAYVGLGELLCEWNDLDEAISQLRQGLERGEQGANARILLPGYVALARVLQAQGDAEGALGAIQEAMHVWQQYNVQPMWSVPPVATYRARLWLAQGDVASAARWVEEQGLRADGKLCYQRELEYITLARLLIAQDKVDDAAGLLHRLLESAKAGGRISRVIEIFVLQALSLQAQKDPDQAIISLENALALAEPGGFVRIFVDEGPSMARLLYTALSRGITPGTIRRLLAAFPVADPVQTAPSKTQAAKPKLARPRSGPLVETLSERELEVLQLLAEGLTNREIASRLFLAQNTVKAHCRNIYGKLGVHSRTQAVARARTLGLLSSV